MSDLVKSILGGISISIAGCAYLSLDNHVIGAALFSLGLLTIYLFDWNLYTGKACFVLSKPPSFLITVAIAFIGNFIGTFLVGTLLFYTKLEKLIPIAEEVSSAKLSNTPFSGFVMGIGCGILMYIAVVGYKTCKGDFEKHLILIMPIIVFTIIGFEHVIANMFYFTMAGVWNIDSLIYILIVGAGNFIGCNFIPFAHKFTKNETLAS